MDCNLARMLLPFAGTRGDLSADDAATLEAHLATCPHCQVLQKAARSFDGPLAQAMQAVAVPVGLREQLGVRLAAAQARLWQRSLARYSAIVASLLFVALLALGWWNSRRHTVDPQRIADLEDVRGAYINLRTREAAEAFFGSQGLTVQLPADFDYALPSSLDIVIVAGEKVAQVEFQRGEHRARVMVFGRKHFQLARNAEREASASHCVVEVTQNADFIYVVIFYGEARRQHFQNQANLVG